MWQTQFYHFCASTSIFMSHFQSEPFTRSTSYVTSLKFHCEHPCYICICRTTWSYLSQDAIIDCNRKGGKKKKKSFELQERGTALKNKGDRCQYINFMRMKKIN